MRKYADVRTTSAILQLMACAMAFLGFGFSVYHAKNNPMIAGVATMITAVSFMITHALGQLLRIAADVGEATAKTAQTGGR